MAWHHTFCRHAGGCPAYVVFDAAADLTCAQSTTIERAIARACNAWSIHVQLVELFGSVRDDWIKTDLHGWLDANEIYPGIAEDLAGAQQCNELYIVTTKQVLDSLGLRLSHNVLQQCY